MREEAAQTAEREERESVLLNSASTQSPYSTHRDPSAGPGSLLRTLRNAAMTREATSATGTTTRTASVYAVCWRERLSATTTGSFLAERCV